MNLHRIYVDEKSDESIRFWMTDDQLEQHKNVLTQKPDCYIISSRSYCEITGVKYGRAC